MLNRTMRNLKLRHIRSLYVPALKKQIYGAAVVVCREEVWRMEKYDFSCKKGETFEQVLYFTDDTGEDMDLTGMTGYCQLREYPGASDVLASATCTVSVAASKVTILFTATQTGALDPGCYVYDFAMKTSGGAITYYIGGAFRIEERVTEVSAS